MPYSVGKSSYPDLKGVTQYVASAEVANQVASLCYEFDTQVASNGDRLTVNEGIRSRSRQDYLYYTVYRKQGGALAAYPYTSTHDHTRGSALDFGITRADGSNRALTPAEFDWLHHRAPERGIRWTGANFSRVEPWHHNGGYPASVAPIPGVNLPGTKIVKESNRTPDTEAAKPIVPETEESDGMKITFYVDAKGGTYPTLWVGNKFWHMTNLKVAGRTFKLPQVLTLLRRYIRADQSLAVPVTFNALEEAIIATALKQVK